jgi:hypothetical protein
LILQTVACKRLIPNSIGSRSHGKGRRFEPCTAHQIPTPRRLEAASGRLRRFRGLQRSGTNAANVAPFVLADGLSASESPPFRTRA